MVSIFPIAYILLDTIFFILLKFEQNAYNPITICFIAEIFKLLIATYFAHTEGSLPTVKEVASKYELIVWFAIPNALYAVGNSMLHYSVGVIPPAIFIVFITVLRIALTATFQPLVSSRCLTGPQAAACFLFSLAILLSTLPEMIKSLIDGRIGLSPTQPLVIYSMTYSVISVAASLTQEKILKVSKSLMGANVVNYSMGVAFQLLILIFHKIQTPDDDLFRGLDIFLVKALPWILAAVGLSASYVLKFDDSIVKLFCGAFALLLFNSWNSFWNGNFHINALFVISWSLSLFAAYIYSNANGKDSYPSFAFLSDLSNATFGSDVENNFTGGIGLSNKEKRPESKGRKYEFFYLLGALLAISIISSSFEFPEEEKAVGQLAAADMTPACPLYEVPDNDKRSNIKVVTTEEAKYTKQFSFNDVKNGNIYISCPGELKILGPDTQESKNVSAHHRKWKTVDHSVLETKFDRSTATTLTPIDDTYNILPWKYVETEYGKHLPYYWVSCSSFPDANLILRPPLPANKPIERKDLPENRRKEILDYINSLSIGSKDSKGVFETIVVIYMDAVSRKKFHKFYRHTLPFIESLMRSKDSDFTAIDFQRLHSAGTNSPQNYPALLAGVAPSEGIHRFYKRSHPEKLREPWLFDIAELNGYKTFSGVSGCHYGCTDNCYENFKVYESFEQGGYYHQYMAETNDRFPGEFSFPASTYCEAHYRSELVSKGCSTCKQEAMDYSDRWVGNKFGMSYILDWWRSWLIAHSNQKKFSVFMFEEAHQLSHNDNHDADLANFLKDLTTRGSKLFSEKTAILVLADHGLHYTPEFNTLTGKIANKQPFGFFLLPRNYLNSHMTEYLHLQHNAKSLLSPYDLRTTIQYWLTGRDWSATLLKNKKEAQVFLPEVYASNYGENMMTRVIPYNRTCNEAGVPSSYCGCNLFPCTFSPDTLLQGEIKHVVSYINNRILNDDPNSLDVCKPLTELDIVLMDDMDTCLFDHGKIIVNAYVTRHKLMLISITFIKKPDGRFHVDNVNTISGYRPVWDICTRMFNERNQPIKIREPNFQFCYCSSKFTVPTYLGKVVSILN